MTHQTIIPYAGGKQKAVRLITQYFPDNLTEMGSPFIGGGSIEIFMQAQGVRVFAGDACRELAIFWQMMCSRPVAVAEAFKEHIPIEYPLDRYREALRSAPYDVDVAVLFYILIECGFSHILARESGGSPRQTEIINRGAWRSRYAKLSRFSAPNLSVYHYDCFEFLDRYPHLFLYCDPPYANSEHLYGFSEDLHGNFPHRKWRDALMAHPSGWVQSYGDCELVRDLYADCVIDEAAWYYGCKQGSQIGKELIIRPPGSEPLVSLQERDAARRRNQRKHAHTYKGVSFL